MSTLYLDVNGTLLGRHGPIRDVLAAARAYHQAHGSWRHTVIWSSVGEDYAAGFRDACVDAGLLDEGISVAEKGLTSLMGLDPADVVVDDQVTLLASLAGAYPGLTVLTPSEFVDWVALRT